MSFLAPLFFAALAALSVPVLLHLIQRERKNVVQFPSLMFVRRIPYSSVRRRRIHNWLLLLLRVTALALIVFAFTRPFVRGTQLMAATTGARDVVILLDRSYSMGHGDQWQRAQRAALDAVGALGRQDRAALVLFDNGAEVAVQSTNDRGRLQAGVQAATLSAAGTRYSPAIKLAGSLLTASTYPRREALVISDFQRTGWVPGDGLRLPEGAVLTPVVVAPTDTRNVAVAPVTLRREQVAGQERVTVTARVINRGDVDLPNVAVTLEIDGLVVGTTRVTLPSLSAGTAAFSPTVLTTANTRGTVRVGDDALARDNVFHFVLSPPRPVPVLVINAARGSREPAVYLARALAIGDAPKFAVTAAAVETVSDTQLQQARIVIVNDASPSQSLSERLQRFVEAGGGLLAIFGPQATWPANVELLPALPARAVDRSRAAAAFGALEYGHAVFEPFRAARSGDFSAVRFYGYRTVSTQPQAQVLARYDDGAPALLAKTVGRGRALAWTSGLDMAWSDLPLRPVFLPFVHQMLRHLADFRDKPSWGTVGQVLDLTQEGDPTQPLVALSPTGTRVPITEERGRMLELSEPGFYEVREQQRPATVLSSAAANVELSESDRTPLDPAEMVAMVSSGAGTRSAGAAATTPVPDETQERSQQVWWYLLFTSILLLIGEAWLARRFVRPV